MQVWRGHGDRKWGSEPQGFGSKTCPPGFGPKSCSLAGHLVAEAPFDFRTCSWPFNVVACEAVAPIGLRDARWERSLRSQLHSRSLAGDLVRASFRVQDLSPAVWSCWVLIGAWRSSDRTWFPDPPRASPIPCHPIRSHPTPAHSVPSHPTRSTSSGTMQKVPPHPSHLITSHPGPYPFRPAVPIPRPILIPSHRISHAIP